MIHTGPAKAFAVFCIGLLSGFGGGLLLGRTAIVVLRSLELLADNEMLMEQLVNQTMDINFPFKIVNDPMLNIYLSVLSNVFGFVTSNLSFVVGVFVGLSVYNLVICKYGETAMGKALALAGPGCLMGITATGYLFGAAFQSFLAFTSTGSIIAYFFIPVLPTLLLSYVLLFMSLWIDIPVVPMMCFLTAWGVQAILMSVIIIRVVCRTKLELGVVFIPITIFKMITKDSYHVPFTTNHLPLMLTITEVFSLASLPTVTLQSRTNKVNIVLEEIFIGVLTSQFLMVAVGMTLFLFCQRGGAAKVCAGAVTSGAAVIAVIESALPVLGPGPTIGALAGVAGAVGVTLAAAGTAADSYGEVIGRYGLVGRLGVTVGAAVGAFLISCTNNGLSAIFMALCAASIPAGFYLPPVFLFLLRQKGTWKLN